MQILWGASQAFLPYGWTRYCLWGLEMSSTVVTTVSVESVNEVTEDTIELAMEKYATKTPVLDVTTKIKYE